MIGGIGHFYVRAQSFTQAFGGSSQAPRAGNVLPSFAACGGLKKRTVKLASLSPQEKQGQGLPFAYSPAIRRLDAGNRKAEFLGDGAGTVPTIVAMMGVFSLRKTVRCGVQPYSFHIQVSHARRQRGRTLRRDVSVDTITKCESLSTKANATRQWPSEDWTSRMPN